MLSFNTWLFSTKEVNKKDIQQAMDLLMHTQNEFFFSLYDSATLHQRAVFYVLSMTKEVFSQDYIIKYNLKSASTVQASLKALSRNELVHKGDSGYYIADPFFEIW